MEWDHKKKATEGGRVIKQERVRSSTLTSPQQQNGVDCGVYMLMNVESLMQVGYNYYAEKQFTWPRCMIIFSIVAVHASYFSIVAVLIL